MKVPTVIFADCDSERREVQEIKSPASKKQLVFLRQDPGLPYIMSNIDLKIMILLETLFDYYRGTDESIPVDDFVAKMVIFGITLDAATLKETLKVSDVTLPLIYDVFLNQVQHVFVQKLILLLKQSGNGLGSDRYSLHHY